VYGGREISVTTGDVGLYGRSGCIEDSADGMAGRGVRKGGFAAWLSRVDGGARVTSLLRRALGRSCGGVRRLSSARPVAKKRCDAESGGAGMADDKYQCFPRKRAQTSARSLLQRAMGTAVGAPYCGGVREEKKVGVQGCRGLPSRQGMSMQVRVGGCYVPSLRLVGRPWPASSRAT